jgi:hypothetical protein
MKPKLLLERGQALIMIAFAAFGLFAVAGLAIDGSAKYSDRRHAQNAADTAALTGALAKASNVSQWKFAAVSRADDNGYDNDLVTNHVQVNNPPISGIYSDCSDVHFNCNDYVQVIIDSTVNTWFARIIGINQTHNHVEAVASTISANDHFNFGGNAIVAMSPTGCALVAGGSTDAHINGGGIFSNSDATCAFKKMSCDGILNINNGTGTVTTVGGYTLNGNCMPDAGMDPFNTQIPFPPPYQEISPPAACGTNGTQVNNKQTGITTLSPGYFSSISGSGQTQQTVYLNPGIYCVGSTLTTSGINLLKVAPPATFGDASGVFFYFMPGGSFTINSTTEVHLWGITQAAVNTDSSLQPYKGFLMYVAPNYATGTPATCKINGTSADQLSGTIYAPYCDLTLNGSSGTVIESQIIGYTVDLTGASGVTLNYPGSNEVFWNIPLQVGLTK